MIGRFGPARTRSRLLRIVLVFALGAATAGLGSLPTEPAIAAGPTTTAPTSSCPTYNPPTSLSLVAGTPQSARLGTPFDTNLQVALTTTNGCPITTSLAGIAVTFSAPGSGPSGSFSASGSNAVLVGTDASGSVSAPPFTANSLTGGYVVVASSSFGSVSFLLVNTASGVPATITAVSPLRQSIKVANLYRQPLAVEVLDATGSPVVGADVTFSLGAGAAGAGAGAGSGASSAGASFAGGDSQATEQTNASGIATSPALIANNVAGKFTATASLPGVTNPTTFSLDNLAGRPPRITSLQTTLRSATVNSRYHQPLQVKVTSAAGSPLQGQTVTFSLGAGAAGAGAGAGSGASSAGASFAGGDSQATEQTNASGIATSPALIANNVAGKFTATASLPGVTNPTTFSLDNLAGRPPRITSLQTTLRSATVNSRYHQPLQVKVTSAAGSPLQGQTVTFSLGAGAAGAGAGAGSGASSAGASFAGGDSQATEQTNASGIATSPALIANNVAGKFTATASLPGVTNPTTFSLDNLAGRPPRITSLQTTLRSATVNSRYHQPLQVKVTSAAGSPLQGQTVTFSLGAGAAGAGAGAGSGASSAGASFAGGDSQATEQTNASGIATSPALIANNVAGKFTATASLPGVTNPTTFSLDNLAGRPPRITSLQTTLRSATVNSRYHQPLQVKVTSAAGSPLQGQTVTFSLGAGAAGAGAGAGSGASSAGASFAGGDSQATEQTNASGIATSPALIANNVAGKFTATASLPGVTNPTTFSLDNLAGPARSLSAGTASTESSTAGDRFGIPLAVTVTDAHGNPVSGVLVTFAAPALGASGRFVALAHRSRTTRVHTNASGIAVAPAFVAGKTAGGYVVTATTRGATPAAFALVNEPVAG